MTYVCNALNQLTLLDQDAYLYPGYDANGNMTSRTSNTGGGGSGWHYTWSEDDRLLQVDLTLDPKIGPYQSTRFRYDAMGRRILRKDNDGTWTRYFYDGLNVILERESKLDPSTLEACSGPNGVS